MVKIYIILVACSQYGVGHFSSDEDDSDDEDDDWDDDEDEDWSD